MRGQIKQHCFNTQITMSVEAMFIEKSLRIRLTYLRQLAVPVL